jgi:hypothetical protein
MFRLFISRQKQPGLGSVTKGQILIWTLFIAASKRLGTKRLPAPLVGMLEKPDTTFILGKSRTKTVNHAGLPPPDHSSPHETGWI